MKHNFQIQFILHAIFCFLGFLFLKTEELFVLGPLLHKMTREWEVVSLIRGNAILFVLLLKINTRFTLYFQDGWIFFLSFYRNKIVQVGKTLMAEMRIKINIEHIKFMGFVECSHRAVKLYLKHCWPMCTFF